MDQADQRFVVNSQPLEHVGGDARRAECRIELAIDDGGGPDLASRRLSREEVVAAFAPGRAPRAASIAIADLVSAPVIALRRGSAITSAVERQATATGHELHLSLESGDPVLLRALAARDFATAILPRSISSLDGPPIEIRSLRPALMLSVLLAWRHHHDITPAARAFVRFVLAEIAPPTTVARP